MPKKKRSGLPGDRMGRPGDTGRGRPDQGGAEGLRGPHTEERGYTLRIQPDRRRVYTERPAGLERRRR